MSLPLQVSTGGWKNAPGGGRVRTKHKAKGNDKGTVKVNDNDKANVNHKVNVKDNLPTELPGSVSAPSIRRTSTMCICIAPGPNLPFFLWSSLGPSIQRPIQVYLYSKVR